MADLMDRADQDLMLHRLAEAETSFHAVLSNVTLESSHKERHIIKSLSGLAEIYLRRSRSTRQDVYKWHCMYLVSMAMQQLLVQYCAVVSALDHDDPLGSYIEEVQSKARHMHKIMEDKLVKSLESQLCPLDKTGKKKTGSLNLDWLTTLHMFCLTKVKEISEQADAKLCDGHSSRDSDVSSMDDRSNADFDEFEEKPKVGLQVDFVRVQTAIMKLVKQVSQDVRSRYIREHLPENMLRQSVTSEMSCLISPTAAPADLALVFERALQGQDYYPAIEDSPEPEPVKPVVEEPPQTERTWAYPLDRDAKLKLFQQGPKKWQWDSVESEAELITSTAESGDDVNGIPGILTVWKAYKKVRSSDFQGRSVPYNLKIFEEMSSLTELGHHVKDLDTASESSDTNGSLVYQASPLNMDAFNLTLADVLTKLADKLRREKEASLARELYKYALGILEDTGIKSQEYSKVAHILKNMGVMKCQEEDVSMGVGLFEEAIKMYERRDNGEISLDLAHVWFEMGMAYMSENDHEGALFHHVMEMVKENYEGHIRQELVEADDDDTDSECSEGESYPLSLCEAKDCFNHALIILRKLRRQSQVDEELYVNVLTRQGDCCIMTGAFDRAIEYYEEALCLFTVVQEPSALPNNAHVLSMMGIANFFLANFPKATTMFDTAHVLHQHLCSTQTSFEMAFTLTMLGITYYLQKQFHRSVASCSKAYEIYTILYGMQLSNLSALHLWFIAQTLYVLGHSYSTMDFHDKAMQYADLCQELLLKTEEEDRDIKLLVKVLKVKADVYSMLENQEHSLYHYQQALEYSQSLGDEKSATALQNQLLNCMAGLHVTTKQYSTAALYLEQALDHQKSMQKSIRGDMVGILSQLGLTYSLSGDLDRAIECYSDCIEVIREVVTSPNPRYSYIFGSLATLYHVKACIQDDNDKMVEYMRLADKNYCEALALDAHSAVSIQYANFLQQQGRPTESLDKLLPFVFGALKRNSPNVVYNGVEQAILPEHFQHELDDIDEVLLESRVYATFLALLCFKELGLSKDAEDCLVILYELAGQSWLPITQTILAYALLEMNLYMEAAAVFIEVGRHQPDSAVALTNMWLSLCCGVYHQVTLGIYLSLCDVWKHQHKVLRREQRANRKKEMKKSSTRDSGYYDNTVDYAMESRRHLSSETHMYTSGVDPGYTSTENLQRDSPTINTADEEIWITEEGVMDTPVGLQMDFESHAVIPEEEDEWRIIEETVKTSLVETDAIMSSKEYSTLMAQDEVVAEPLVIMENEVPEVDLTDSEEWHTEEVVVETPAAVLALLQQQNQVDANHNGEPSTELMESVIDQQQQLLQAEEKYLVVHKEQRWRREEAEEDDDDDSLAHKAPKQPEPEPEPEEVEIWETSEETVETPAAIMQLLKNSYNNGLDSAYSEENGNSHVYTNEIRESSPAKIVPSPQDYTLNNMKNVCDVQADLSESSEESQSTEHVGDTVSMEQATVDQVSDEEETWEAWEMEETVETPPEVLRALLASQHR